MAGADQGSRGAGGPRPATGAQARTQELLSELRELREGAEKKKKRVADLERMQQVPDVVERVPQTVPANTCEPLGARTFPPFPPGADQGPPPAGEAGGAAPGDPKERPEDDVGIGGLLAEVAEKFVARAVEEEAAGPAKAAGRKRRRGERDERVDEEEEEEEEEDAGVPGEANESQPSVQVPLQSIRTWHALKKWAEAQESIGNNISALWRVLRKQGATDVGYATFWTRWKRAKKRWGKSGRKRRPEDDVGIGDLLAPTPTPAAAKGKAKAPTPRSAPRSPAKRLNTVAKTPPKPKPLTPGRKRKRAAPPSPSEAPKAKPPKTPKTLTGKKKPRTSTPTPAAAKAKAPTPRSGSAGKAAGRTGMVPGAARRLSSGASGPRSSQRQAGARRAGRASRGVLPARFLDLA